MPAYTCLCCGHTETFETVHAIREDDRYGGIRTIM
jgi:hypothetical protein